MATNPNYTESDDGYQKNEHSTRKGDASYFERPLPPVRDTANRPLVPNSEGKIDIARWIAEVNDGK